MSNTMFEQTLEGYSASIPAVTRNTEYRRNIKTSEVDIKPQKIRTAAYARVSSRQKCRIIHWKIRLFILLTH